MAPSTEQQLLETLSQSLLRAKQPTAIAELLAAARLSGSLPPRMIIHNLLPVLNKWLADRRMANWPMTWTLRSFVQQWAARSGDAALEKRLSQDTADLRNWAWLGPFGDEQGSAFAHSGPVEARAAEPVRADQPVAGRNGPVLWQPVPADFVSPGQRIPLEELVERAADAVIYVQTWVKPGQPGPAQLRLGVDGRVRVWLDGRLVMQRDAKPELYGIDDQCPSLPMVDTAEVTLRAGWQRLLVKLAPAGPSLPLSAGFFDAKGAALSVESAALPPADASTPTNVDATAPKNQPAAQPAGVNPQSPSKAASPWPALVALAWHGWPMNSELSEQLLAATADDLPADPQLALGDAMLAGELGDRIDGLRRWALRLPDSAELLVAQAEALDQMGKTTQAHRLWHDWVEIHQQHPEDVSIHACSVRVALWNRLGADLAAAELLEKCGKRWPQSPAILQAQLRLAQAHDQLAQTAHWTDLLLQEEPGRLMRHMAHLQSLFHQSDDATLVAIAEGITKRFGQRSRAFEAVGQLFLAQDQPQAAAALLARIPESQVRASTLDLRGRVWARLGQTQAALTAWKAALAAAPARADVRTRLQLLRPAGDFYAWYQRDLLALVHKERSVPRKVPLEQRLRQTVLQVVGNGQQARYDAEINYFGPGTEPNHDVTIDYAPSVQRAEVLEAAVIRADGRVERNIAQEAEQVGDDESGMYFDLERIVLHFKGLKAGDSVIVQYSVRDLQPTAFGLVFGELLQLGDIFPIRETDIAVLLPENTPFYYEVHDPARPDQAPIVLQKRNLPRHEADRDDPGPWDQWRLQLGPQAGVTNEERMPGGTDSVAYLHMSSFADWPAAVQWYRTLMAEALPQPGSDVALHETALRLTQGLDSVEQKARALYNYTAAQVRYVGLEFGIHSLKPHAAREVMQRQFGDCKDKATLLVALLAEVGIEAQVALVRTVDEGRLHDRVASLGVFNHAIAYIPELGWWLDATAQRHSPLELPAGDREGMALRIVGPKATALAQVERLPLGPATSHQRQETDRVQVHADGSADLTIQLDLQGLPAADVRSRLGTAQARKEHLEHDLVGRYAGLQVLDVTTEGIDPLADHVRVRIKAHVPQWAQPRATGLVSRPLQPATPYLQGIAAATKRVHPLVLDHGMQDDLTVEIVPPPGWQVQQQPADAQAEQGPHQFANHCQMQSSALRCESKVRIGERRIDPKDYSGFRAWLGNVDAGLRGELRLMPAGGTP